MFAQLLPVSYSVARKFNWGDALVVGGRGFWLLNE